MQRWNPHEETKREVIKTEIPEIEVESKAGWFKIGENFVEISISKDGVIWGLSNYQ